MPGVLCQLTTEVYYFHHIAPMDGSSKDISHNYFLFLFLFLQEQYETVFDAVLVFLDSFDTYSNFGQ